GGRRRGRSAAPAARCDHRRRPPVQPGAAALPDARHLLRVRRRRQLEARHGSAGAGPGDGGCGGPYRGPPRSLMSISAPFIRRPVGTTLLTAALVLAGVLGFRLLPVAPLPQVDFPTIQIVAGLPGASPETMASPVPPPPQPQLGRLAGVPATTTTSFLRATTIPLHFDLARDINGA